MSCVNVSGKKKRAQRLTFWVRRPPGRVGVSHMKGWWPKSSCPPSKFCLPWVSKRGIWDVPGILPGCPSISGKKKAHKRFCPGDFTGFVPGTNPVKTWDKPGLSPYFTQWKPFVPGFVPGTNPVCPWDNPGDEGRHRKFM